MTESMLNRLTGKRVLVVEDEYLIAEDLAHRLEKYGAIVIGPIATVEEALELAFTNFVDCAVVDINLRGKTAFALLDRLLRQQLPVVIVTGYDPEDVPDRFRELAFIQKPEPLNQDAILTAVQLSKRSTKH